MNDWIHGSDTEEAPTRDRPAHSAHLTPSMSRRKRVIAINYLGEKGFLKRTARVIIPGGSTEDGEYHGEMTADVYEEWVDGVLDTVASKNEKVALIMGNELYHSRRSNKISSKQSEKKKIVDFLVKFSVEISTTRRKQTVEVFLTLVKEVTQGST